MKKTRVAFLGLGIMGEPMARNLLRGGCELRVWNRTSSRAAVLVDEGALHAGSPADAVREAERRQLYAELGKAPDAVFPLRFRAEPGLATGAVSGRVEGFYRSDRRDIRVER